MKRHCDDLDPIIEAIADGSYELAGDEAAHLASCPLCSIRLERARAIESWLMTREAAAPSATFSAGVMARVGHEQWRTERVVDLGFNLAMAAGILVILAGGAGLAWSLGFLSITIDVEAIVRALDTPVTNRVLSEVQTLVMAAGVLTLALVLWWWAETASD
jgi:hypothetical protein